MGTQEQLIQLAARMANLQQDSELGDDEVAVVTRALGLLREGVSDQSFNTVAMVGTLTVSFLKMLNNLYLGMDQQGLNSFLIPAITHEMSAGALKVGAAPTPLSSYNEWLSSVQMEAGIGLSRRIVLTEQAQVLLDAGEDMPIRARHRLEMWACGLVPQDMISLLAPINVFEDKVLALPTWITRDHQGPEGVVKVLSVTRLPHSWWIKEDKFKESIRSAVEWVFQHECNPSDHLITTAIFEGITRSAFENSVRIEVSDPELLPPDTLTLYVFEDGTVSLTAERPAPVVLDDSDATPESFGEGLAAAQERQAELLGDAVPPAIDTASLRPFGEGLAAAQERQEQLLHPQTHSPSSEQQ